VRNGARTGGRGAAVLEDDDFDGRGRRLAVLQALGWSHRDAVGFVVAASASVAILVNVLFLQTGAHPAPMVTSSVAAPVAAPVELASASVTVLPTIPRQRPVEAPVQPAQPQSQPQPQAQPQAQPPATTRPQAAIVTDIQRELARRGFYDGTVDGRYGPRTDAAIRDFEQSAGLRPSTAPDEALLRAIVRAPITVRQQQPARRSSAPSGPTPPARIDPIAEMLTPSKRVVAIQRALTEFGYGQIDPSGLVDPETQVAIEKFERQRKLPITGQVSERVVRELAGITGRPIE
jgi:peptidoglycan hydrolase-like protein with peptidoglycan-binding domain